MTEKKPLKTERESNATISVLSSAGLATALISWVATAQGLQKYVFTEWWQAFVISGAIQSSLFTCNIKGPFILKRLRWYGKIAFLLFYLLVLGASSTFSFVYIESVAYPDELFRDDANRILVDDCLRIDYMMSNSVEQHMKNIIKEINEYITILSTATEDGGTDKPDYTSLKQEIEKLDPNEDITLISAINKILNYDYNTTDLDNVRTAINTTRKNLEEKKETSLNEINGMKEQYITEVNRLGTFKQDANGNNQAYMDANTNANGTYDKMDEEMDKITVLQDKLAVVDAISNQIDYIEKGLDFNLKESTRMIRKLMNELEFKENSLSIKVSDIYNTLIENGVQSSDPRLEKYSIFKENVRTYEKLRSVSTSIENEINVLYAVYAKMDFEKNEESQEKEEKSISVKQEYVEWRREWKKRFEKIRKNLKDIPFFELQSDGSDNTIEASKTGVLKFISEKERLYVSDMVDFEKAWRLLFFSHEYKLMVIFSAVSAVFLDIFSAVMGILIYLYRKSLNNMMDKE